MKAQSTDLKIIPVIAPAANANLGTTALTGTVVNTAGFESLTFVIQTGTLSDADAVYSVLVEDGATTAVSDGAVADAYLIGTEALAGFTYAEDGYCFKIGYIGTKQYVRLTVTPTTTADSGNSPISALAILGNPRVMPQSDQSLAS